MNDQETYGHILELETVIDVSDEEGKDECGKGLARQQQRICQVRMSEKNKKSCVRFSSEGDADNVNCEDECNNSEKCCGRNLHPVDETKLVSRKYTCKIGNTERNECAPKLRKKRRDELSKKGGGD